MSSKVKSFPEKILRTAKRAMIAAPKVAVSLNPFVSTSIPVGIERGMKSRGQTADRSPISDFDTPNRFSI